MAQVFNPTVYDLFCHPLGKIILPGQRVEATAEQAARISRSVFIIEDDPEAVGERPSGEAVSTRSKSTRGSKTVEQNDPPELETR